MTNPNPATTVTDSIETLIDSLIIWVWECPNERSLDETLGYEPVRKAQANLLNAIKQRLTPNPDTVTISRACAENALEDAAGEVSYWEYKASEADSEQKRSHGERLANLYRPFVIELKEALALPEEL